MKLIKFAIDYRATLNLPNLNKGEILYPRGTILKVTDDRARYFVRRVIDWDYYVRTGRIKKVFRPAYILKDLGCYHQKVCRERKI